MGFGGVLVNPSGSDPDAPSRLVTVTSQRRTFGGPPSLVTTSRVIFVPSASTLWTTAVGAGPDSPENVTAAPGAADWGP